MYLFTTLTFSFIGTTVISAFKSNRNCITVESRSELLMPTQTKIVTSLSDEKGEELVEETEQNLND